MIFTDGDRRGVGDARNEDGRQARGTGAIAQLTIAISSPAFHLPPRNDGTGVSFAGRDCGSPGGDIADLNRRGLIARIAVADLPVVIIAPAEHRAASAYRATVLAAHADLLCRQTSRHGCRAGVARIEHTIAELASPVGAPTLDRASRAQASMGIANTDFIGVFAVGDHLGRSGSMEAALQLIVTIVPPALDGSNHGLLVNDASVVSGGRNGLG